MSMHVENIPPIVVEVDLVPDEIEWIHELEVIVCDNEPFQSTIVE